MKVFQTSCIVIRHSVCTLYMNDLLNHGFRSYDNFVMQFTTSKIAMLTSSVSFFFPVICSGILKTNTLIAKVIIQKRHYLHIREIFQIFFLPHRALSKKIHPLFPISYKIHYLQKKKEPSPAIANNREF